MKINWKVRFKNKVWLASVIGALVSFVFTMLGLFDIFPTVTENEVLKIVNAGLFIFEAMGIIVDPTTSGAGDSERALGYEEPWTDEETENG